MALTGHGDVQISTFSSSKAFLQQWKRGVQADLLFLDIQFDGEMDGIELAKEIRLTNDSVPIVFITNYEAYWRDGYEVNALRYLSKPVSYEAIAPCLDIAFRRRQTSPQDFFVLDEAGKRIALRFSEIVYLEAQSPYLVIRTTDDTLRLRCRFAHGQHVGGPGQQFVILPEGIEAVLQLAGGYRHASFAGKQYIFAQGKPLAAAKQRALGALAAPAQRVDAAVGGGQQRQHAVVFPIIRMAQHDGQRFDRWHLISSRWNGST